MAKELPKDLVDKLLALDRATVAGLPGGIAGDRLTLPASIPVPQMLQGLQRSVEDAQQGQPGRRRELSLPLSIPHPGSSLGAFPDTIPQLPKSIPFPGTSLPASLASTPGLSTAIPQPVPGLPRSIPSPALTLPSGKPLSLPESIPPLSVPGLRSGGGLPELGGAAAGSQMALPTLPRSIPGPQPAGGSQTPLTLPREIVGMGGSQSMPQIGGSSQSGGGLGDLVGTLGKVVSALKELMQKQGEKKDNGQPLSTDGDPHYLPSRTFGDWGINRDRRE